MVGSLTLASALGNDTLDVEAFLDGECTAACSMNPRCEAWRRLHAECTLLERTTSIEHSDPFIWRSGAVDTRACDGAKFYSKRGFRGSVTDQRPLSARAVESLFVPPGCIVHAKTFSH